MTKIDFSWRRQIVKWKNKKCLKHLWIHHKRQRAGVQAKPMNTIWKIASGYMYITLGKSTFVKRGHFELHSMVIQTWSVWIWLQVSWAATSNSGAGISRVQTNTAERRTFLHTNHAMLHIVLILTSSLFKGLFSFTPSFLTYNWAKL